MSDGSVEPCALVGLSFSEPRECPDLTFETQPFIYTLSEPDTGKVRYVGKTINLRKRFYGHINPKCRLKPNRKNNWVSSVVAAGKLPKLTVIKVVTAREWEESERATIKHFRQLSDLTNGTDGGEGGSVAQLKGVRRSAEIKAKISQSKLGHSVAETTRAKISKTLTGYKHNESARRNMAASSV